MSRIIIICVESSKQAGFDDKYIDSIVKYYYGDKDPIRYVNMDGKGNFSKKNVKQNITEKSVGFKNVNVVYAIDLDYFEMNPNQNELNERIISYCKHLDYDLVWFLPNIEYVLTGNDVDKDKKRQMVTQFVRNNQIQWIDSSYLESTQFKKGYSNILLILDKYLQRKKR